MIWSKDKSKTFLIPMIFPDEGFEWRFEVEQKDRRDRVLSRNALEVVSNLDRSKWEKSDEAEEIFLVGEKEILKDIEVVPSKVELGRIFWNEIIKVSLNAFLEEELN